MGRRVKVILLLLIFAAALFGLAWLDLPYVSLFAKLTLGAAAVVLLPWLAWRAYNAFLYKVGRRLAFSYFLVGVLPIPMIALLSVVVVYLASGFFLGHLFRDAAARLQAVSDVDDVVLELVLPDVPLGKHGLHLLGRRLRAVHLLLGSTVKEEVLGHGTSPVG